MSFAYRHTGCRNGGGHGFVECEGENGGEGPTEATPGAPVGGDLADGLQAACRGVLLKLHKVCLHHTRL